MFYEITNYMDIDGEQEGMGMILAQGPPAAYLIGPGDGASYGTHAWLIGPGG